MRIVVDTNVVVAAARNPNGASAAVLGLTAEGFVTMLATTALCFEYAEVCLRPEHMRAARATRAQMENFLDAIVEMVAPVRVHFQWRPQLFDPDDEAILEAAVNGRAAAIVTFNTRHLLPARDLFGVELLSPGQLLTRLVHG